MGMLDVLDWLSSELVRETVLGVRFLRSLFRPSVLRERYRVKLCKEIGGALLCQS